MADNIPLPYEEILQSCYLKNSSIFFAVCAVFSAVCGFFGTATVSYGINNTSKHLLLFQPITAELCILKTLFHLIRNEHSIYDLLMIVPQWLIIIAVKDLRNP